MAQQGNNVIPFDKLERIASRKTIEFPTRKKTVQEKIVDAFIRYELPTAVEVSIVYRDKDGTFGYLTDKGSRAAMFHFLEEAKIRFLLDGGNEVPPGPKVS